MRKRTAAWGWVHEALIRARYEVVPTANIVAAVTASVPRDVQLTVTSSPSKGISATIDLTERLRNEGYSVIPHLAARMISGRSELAEIVDRLTTLGVDDVFCPAGDADPAVGDYAEALPLLEDLVAMGDPFRSVGITGYPERHPAIEDDVTIQSMWDKRRHATYIVSNLCFDPRVVARWVHRVRRRHVTLPILVGLAGPVERTKLLAMATKIGVGDSMRFLSSHRSAFARIAAPGGYSPERFLERASHPLSDADTNVTGLHVFTFNQVAATEAWRQRLLDRGP